MAIVPALCRAGKRGSWDNLRSGSEVVAFIQIFAGSLVCDCCLALPVERATVLRPWLSRSAAWSSVIGFGDHRSPLASHYPACTPAAASSLDKNDRVYRDVACEECLFSPAPQAPARTWFHWPARSVGSALCTTVLEFSSGSPLRQVLTNQPLQPVLTVLGCLRHVIST